MENEILIGIIITCVLLLVLGVVRHKMELLVNVLLRMVMGIVGIYLLNAILSSQDILVNVGINETTIVTVGFLGLPGFLLIYGVEFYYMLFK